MWSIPLDVRNSSSRLFTNYVPLSLRILRTRLRSCTSALVMKFMSVEAVSDFRRKKNTQDNFVKSSTITSIYFFLFRLSTVEGPHKSMCSSCSGSVIAEWTTDRCRFFACFPHSQGAHRVSLSNLSSGRWFLSSESWRGR